jgi:hypothetical protein
VDADLENYNRIGPAWHRRFHVPNAISSIFDERKILRAAGFIPAGINPAARCDRHSIQAKEFSQKIAGAGCAA